MKHLDKDDGKRQGPWRALVAAVRWYLTALAGDETVAQNQHQASPSKTPWYRGCISRLVASETLERYWTSRRWWLATGLVVTLLLSGPAGLLLQHTALLEHVLAATGSNFAAPPFFTLEGFHALRPGMTSDEVRDLVGFPLCRDERALGPGWFYTQPARPASSRFKLCIAVFDRESGRLASAKEVEATCPQGPVTPLRYPWTATLRRRVGELRLLRTDGVELLLKPDANGYFLSLQGQLAASPEATHVSPGAMTESTPASIHLYALGNKTSRGGKPEFLGTFAETRPTLPTNLGIFEYLYIHGEVYALPPWNEFYATDMRDDRDWLVRHLAGRPVSLALDD